MSKRVKLIVKPFGIVELSSTLLAQESPISAGQKPGRRKFSRVGRVQFRYCSEKRRSFRQSKLSFLHQLLDTMEFRTSKRSLWNLIRLEMIFSPASQKVGKKKS